KIDHNISKVAFAVSFMRDYTATWSQLYLEKIFKDLPVVFDDFLNNFRSSFFDHNRRHCAKVALWNLCQTGTVSAYTQDLPAHSHRGLDQYPAHEPLPARPQGEYPACLGDEQH
ncbi:uncharacterized protein VP01_15208g1, partial [Puccinia sorghi]